MALAFGNKVISKAYFGGKTVSAIYLGTKKVFPEEEEEYLPGTGDIRLRIETTSANQSFQLFYRITTESGGYVSVDWGDGNTETLTGKTTYQPTHTYATAGEYVVKLTGSKFTGVNGVDTSNYYRDFQIALREILSLKMPTDSTSVQLYWTFYFCSNLTGSIPEWGTNITNADSTYYGCYGLTGSIPAWGANITSANETYYNCSGLTDCSEELLQDPMPSRITNHDRCVRGCVDAIRQHFTPEWGGTKAEAVEYIPGTGDIRLQIQTTSANQSFQLFYEITTESGGYVSIDWGDGDKETFTGKTTYQPTHTYVTTGEYIVKLTGSKFTGVNGHFVHTYYEDFTLAVREILSLKMPTDSASVSLEEAFCGCDNLTGNIPAWDDCITDANSTYEGCTSLTGRIPAWGANITNAWATYEGCTSLTGRIPAWGANITNATYTYRDCTGLTGNIPAWGANITNAWATYWNCPGLTGNIPEWGANITDAEQTYEGCAGLTGNIPEWGANITDATYTYHGCTGLTGNIPAWGANITNAYGTYWKCTGLTGEIPEWGANITNATYTYRDCTGLTGNIPAWGANITYTNGTYQGCSGLTGNIPEWGANITNATYTYRDCAGLTDCSDELLQDPMPSRITSHADCVSGCVDAIRQHFKQSWGGTKPG